MDIKGWGVEEVGEHFPAGTRYLNILTLLTIHILTFHILTIHILCINILTTLTILIILTS